MHAVNLPIVTALCTIQIMRVDSSRLLYISALKVIRRPLSIIEYLATKIEI